MIDDTDTIAALATAPGQAALALVRLSGTRAIHIAARLFHPASGENLQSLPAFSVRYGSILEENGGLLDDGLITLFHSPRSYTGEEGVELSCHGSPAVVERLLTALYRCGARPAEPGEFTRRAFLNGRLDLARAEAVADIINARTEQAARAAHKRLEGSLSRRIKGLRDKLIGLLAAIEAGLDFSEETGEFDTEQAFITIENIQAELEGLLASAPAARILRDGLKIALIGPPNAGKSSLMNALLQSERAIVTPFPGTTRDTLEESFVIEGFPIVLTDTAGLRDSTDPIEQIGIERARKSAEESDLILLVLDITDPASFEKSRDCLPKEAPSFLLVLNKCDLAAPEYFPPDSALRDAHRVSALTGKGIEALRQAILGFITASGGAFADPESALVASARHQYALEGSLKALQEAKSAALSSLPSDFLSIDLRAALDWLGQITGETVTDEIVHRIFQDFCVGK